MLFSIPNLTHNAYDIDILFFPVGDQVKNINASAVFPTGKGVHGCKAAERAEAK